MQHRRPGSGALVALPVRRIAASPPRPSLPPRAATSPKAPFGAAPSFPEPARATAAAGRAAAPASASSPSSSSASAPEPTVEELMDPHAPVLREDTPLRDAARLFLTTGAQSAAVVDERGALVGVLSESDLVLKSSGVPAEDHWLLPPVYIGVLDATLALRDQAAWRAEVDKILAKDVGHAMTRGAARGGKAGKGGGLKGKGAGELVTARPDEPVSSAAARMARHHVNMLPVVEEAGGRVVGALTRHDVLRGLYATHGL